MGVSDSPANHHVFLLLLLHLSNISPSVQLNMTREDRLLNLFSIVTFSNDGCTASSGDTGLCISGSECSTRGGTIEGSCAQGFGACCVVTSSACGGTITYNTSYITNPGYPSSYTTAETCSWTFEKSQSDVCMIRLDFAALTLAAPQSGTTPNGACTTDYFQGVNAVTGTTSGSTGKTLPKICGVNTGQHIYIDAGTQTSNNAVLNAVLTGSTARTWKMLVTQIPCDSRTLPPTGCLQYYTGTTGQLRSFNFLASSSSYQHLNDQYYKICIRREERYCRIGYTQSTDPDSF